MATHYEDKRNALLLIDKMLMEKEPLTKIYFKIETMYGFSQKIVDNRIIRLQEMEALGKKGNK